MGMDKKILLFTVMLIIVAVFAFCLQIKDVGFYLDDWLFIESFQEDGVQGIYNYTLNDSRPFSAWVSIIGATLWGTSSLAWQLFALALRCIATFAFWLTINKFIPRQFIFTSASALLFFVFPIFVQQSTALVFSFHWASFSLFLFSIFLNLQAIDRNGVKRLVYTLIAVFFSAMSLFTTEHFLGIELFRPIILMFYLLTKQKSLKKCIWYALYYYLPYAVVIGTYSVWRFIVFPSQVADRNSLSSLRLLFENPIKGVLTWIEMIVSSFAEATIGSLYKIIQPSAIRFFPRETGLSWIFASCCIVGVGLIFLLIQKKNTYSDKISKKQSTILLIIGFVLAALGFLPGWSIGRTIADSAGNYNDRFGLAAGLGCVLIFVSLIDLSIKSEKAKCIMLAVLIGLSAGYQYRSQTVYVLSWQKQKNTAWQLINRVPAVKLPTVFFANRVTARFMGNWADTILLNQLYDPQRNGAKNGVWYMIFNEREPNVAVTDTRKFLSFESAPYESLAMILQESNHCLWVLKPDDIDNPYLPDSAYNYVESSNLSRIIPDAEVHYDTALWGNKPKPDWCLYYQRQELAAQNKDWDTVISAAAEAEIQGFHTHTPTEHAPLIEAYAMTGQWEKAAQLTDDASKTVEDAQHNIDYYLCRIWKRAEKEYSDENKDQAQIQLVYERLSCPYDFE